MIKRALALRYAKALFDMDRGNDNLEMRLNHFDFILDLLHQHPNLMRVLVSPQILLEEKKHILETNLRDKGDSSFFNFLFFMIEKGRLNSLKQIAEEYRMMFNKYLDIWEAKIVTAVPIGQDIEEGLKKKLENYYHKKIKIVKEVDPKIIGGAILIFANEMIDWSVKGRLKKIKENISV